MYDEDKNGSIDKNEMLKVVKAIIALTGRNSRGAEKMVDKIFKVLDTVRSFNTGNLFLHYRL